MAARRWTIRNYNAALREIRKRTGASHREAQAAYRALTFELGKLKTDGTIDRKRGLRAKDVKAHPRIVKRSRRMGIESVGGGAADRGGGAAVYPIEFEDLDLMYEGYEADEEAEY